MVFPLHRDRGATGTVDQTEFRLPGHPAPAQWRRHPVRRPRLELHSDWHRAGRGQLGADYLRGPTFARGTIDLDVGESAKPTRNGGAVDESGIRSRTAAAVARFQTGLASRRDG